MIPINAVCPANLEKMKETIKTVLEAKLKDLNEPGEYYIMPRRNLGLTREILKILMEHI